MSKGHRVGKSNLKKNIKEEASFLINNLNENIKDRNAFLVCHKDVEAIVNRFDTNFTLATSHWGAINGKNDWKDHDTVVIFGLPYLPSTWPASTYMVFRGIQSTEWLRNKDARPFNGYTDIRESIRNGQMSSSIIQAINRIRARKVIDEEGNCPESEGYILLPKGKLADDILEDIKRLMPGIQIKDWNYSKKTTRKARSSNYDMAMMKYFENADCGKYPSEEIRVMLGMSPRTIKRKTALMKDKESELSKFMNGLGVEYKTMREGRTERGYFIKDDPYYH